MCCLSCAAKEWRVTLFTSGLMKDWLTDSPHYASLYVCSTKYYWMQGLEMIWELRDAGEEKKKDITEHCLNAGPYSELITKWTVRCRHRRHQRHERKRDLFVSCYADALTRSWTRGFSVISVFLSDQPVIQKGRQKQEFMSDMHVECRT